MVASSPGDEHARALLAMRIVFTDPPRARALVEGIHEATHDGPLAGGVLAILRCVALTVLPDTLPAGEARDTYLSAALLLSRGDFDGALEKFIDVIRTDRTYDDDGGRRCCLAVFAYLGEDHPVTRGRRREFGSALYV